MVHVAVGKDDGADMRLVFNQVGDIGNNDIHAQQLRLREHQPGVDHDNVVFPAEREAVHAELAESAQGNDFQLFCMHLSDLMLPPMGFGGSNILLSCPVPVSKMEFAPPGSSIRRESARQVHFAPLPATAPFPATMREE